MLLSDNYVELDHHPDEIIATSQSSGVKWFACLPGGRRHLRMLHQAHLAGTYCAYLRDADDKIIKE